MARCMLLLLFLFMPTSAQAEIRNPDPGLSIGGAGGSLATTIMGLGTGNDAYTRLLLHFDRDNSDASPWRRQQIAGAMAVPSSVRSKFGGYSGAFSSSCPQYALHGADGFAANDFTVDLWIWPLTVAPNTQVLFYQANASHICPIYLNIETTSVKLYCSNNGTTWALCGLNGSIIGTVAADTAWYHIAVARSGNNLRTFFNGALVSTIDVTGATLMTPTKYVEIGCYNGATYYSGYIDELRVDIGIARWTAAFTPPASAYGNLRLELTGSGGAYWLDVP